MSIGQEYLRLLSRQRHQTREIEWEEVPSKKRCSYSKQGVKSQDIRKMATAFYASNELKHVLSQEESKGVLCLLERLYATFSKKTQADARRVYNDRSKRQIVTHSESSVVGALIRLKKLINRLSAGSKHMYTDIGHVVAICYMLYISCPWCRSDICKYFNCLDPL